MIDFQLISVQETALKMGVSTRQVYRHIHENGLPAVRVGKRKMAVSVSALEQWLEKRLVSCDTGVATESVAVKEKKLCHTDVKTRLSTGPRSPMRAAKELGNRLGLLTERRP
jgi:excisionase family DNA binding protein